MLRRQNLNGAKRLSGWILVEFSATVKGARSFYCAAPLHHDPRLTLKVADKIMMIYLSYRARIGGLCEELRLF